MAILDDITQPFVVSLKALDNAGVLDDYLARQYSPYQKKMLFHMVSFIENFILPYNKGCEAKVIGGYGKDQPADCTNVPLLNYARYGSGTTAVGDSWVARIFFTESENMLRPHGPRIAFPIEFLNPRRNKLQYVDYGFKDEEQVPGEKLAPKTLVRTTRKLSFFPVDTEEFFMNTSKYLNPPYLLRRIPFPTGKKVRA